MTKEQFRLAAAAVALWAAMFGALAAAGQPVGLTGPVARVVLADPACRTADNPRGWLVPPDRLDAQLDRCITRALELGCTALQLTDVEGQEFDHPGAEPRVLPQVSYLGDPRVLSPDVDADDVRRLSRKCTDAGLAVGGTVRHTTPTVYGQVTLGGAFETLDAKVRYARAAFGWTYFYVDSNAGHGLPGLVPADAFDRLAREHPDCVFVVEHWDRSYDGLPANVWDWEHVELGQPAPLPRGRKVVAVDGFNDSPDAARKVRLLAATGNVPVVDVWTPDGLARFRRMVSLWKQHYRNPTERERRATAE